MKVLMINGSAHKHGSTFRALQEVEKTLLENGIESEIIHIGSRPIQGCTQCGKCRELHHCIFTKDDVNDTAEKLKEADGLVIGSPVHYAGPTGPVHTFLDRLFYSSIESNKSMKVGASIAVARRAGTIATMDVLNKYFSISEMPIAGSTYWNEIHGMNAQDVEKDEEGLQTLRQLGRNIAFMIKALQAEKTKTGLPIKEPEIRRTNFIR